MSATPEEHELPAQLYAGKYGRGDAEPIFIDAFLNKAGLVTISLDEDSWIQMSPIVAKQLVERLRSAVGEALVDMLGANNDE